MMRKKKLFLNTGISLLNQLITIVCGFVLPRFILKTYGSATNGMVSSISQFLGFISLCECGVGAVVQSALYKPLAEKNNTDISKIVKSSNNFFRVIAIILVPYTIALIFGYPYIINDTTNKVAIGVLVFAISINYFAQYYFGMTYKLLLNADQLSYIQYGINSVVLIGNTILSIVFMKLGFSIQVVKLVASLVFILQPLALAVYAKTHYTIDRKIHLDKEPIEQKWNGLAQHVATVVLTNTDTVVLTIFSSLENVSVYGVYHLVVAGVKQLVMSMTSGVQALMGNLYAKREEKLLNEFFSSFEWMLHTFVTFVFGMTTVLIVPFVRVYTQGITDANYIVPVFAFLITMAQAFYCYRLPYSLMTLAAGHYKQTQSSAIIEAILNVSISVILVKKFGLIGVAIGTIISMGYRTVYLAWYLKNSILNRNLKYFVKQVLIDTLSIALMYCSTRWLTLQNVNYISWLMMAIIAGVICAIEVAVVNCIFCKDIMKTALHLLKKK